MNPDAGPFFRRYFLTGADAAEAEAEIVEDQAALASSMVAGDQHGSMEAHLRLGSNLIPLRQEAPAVTHLDEALRLARQLGDRGSEIETLLQLGTAHQYLGDRQRAQELFQRGLDLSTQAGITTRVHFLLHHRGRCYAEQGQTAQARDCFSQALAIREQLGDQRFITSTRNALAQLPAADRA